MKNYGIASRETLNSINGDVQTVISLSYDINDGHKKLTSHSRAHYNIKGQIHRDEGFELEGTCTFNSYMVYRFDENGNKIGFDHFIRDKFYSSLRYLLDTKGRIISNYRNNDLEPSSVYIYDDSNNTKESIYFKEGAHTLYELDENGFAIRLLTIIGITPLSASKSDVKISEITTFVNNCKGNIIEWKVIDAFSKEMKSMHTFQLNEHSDEIEAIHYIGDGTIYTTVQYEYKYDHKANWIFRRTLRFGGLPTQEEERKITYYSDSI